MEGKRDSWNSNLGFVLAAIGSAVGLGNIWGFPFKMGKSGGFMFLLLYLLMALFIGLIIMASEIALGRKTGMGCVGAYRKLSKKFGWVGWMAVIASMLIVGFYSALGGYCIQYLSVNLAELSFGLSNIFGQSITGSATFGAMLTNPFGCSIFTATFVIICMLVVKSGISGGIEKFNKIGMPALTIMLIIIIIRSLTLPNAMEGVKFMFVPGYAVKAGFIDEAPHFLEVLGTAGGQMFFSLSLAAGPIITFGSYLGKKENLPKNAGVIVFADTLIAIMAGFAVIPAAVANAINSGIPMNEIALGGPTLLFVTLQDVFANMGPTGPLFGVIFYLLVVVAAISSAISMIEVVATYFIDKAAAKGKTGDRTKILLWVSVFVLLEAVFVAVDGLGGSGVFKFWGTSGWNDCALDLLDCAAEGLLMPLGAMIMSIMIGWELKPKAIIDEFKSGSDHPLFDKFYTVCVKFIAPVGMAFVLVGQFKSFFGNVSDGVWYIVSAVLLVGFIIFASAGNKKENKA